MRIVGLKWAVGMAGVLACLAWGVPPALASSASVQLIDGSSVKVWEQRGRVSPGRGLAPWSINYSITDAAGTRQGIVSPTGDTARDSAPFLVLDEVGFPVLVWSRFDGTYRKIAYSRLMGGVWSDFHYLTFGAGDDDEPRVGAGAALAYLFFTRGPGIYQYAPLDLMTGRLFAAPRGLDFGSARNDIRTPPGASVRATVDIPVVNRCNAEKGACGGGRPGVPASPNPPMVQGGTVDIPIVNGRASVWGVGSSAGCTQMILVVPDHTLKTAFVFRFLNGISHLLERLSLPPQIEARWGEGVAASYLPSSCY